MKKFKIIALSLVAILGLTMAVFAFGKVALNAKVSAQSKASCCNGTSCESGGGACCDDASCCSGGVCKMNGACCGSGDACAMKKSQKAATTEKAAFDTSKVTVEDAGGGSCCHGKK